MNNIIDEGEWTITINDINVRITQKGSKKYEFEYLDTGNSLVKVNINAERYFVIENIYFRLVPLYTMIMNLITDLITQRVPLNYWPNAYQDIFSYYHKKILHEVVEMYMSQIRH